MKSAVAFRNLKFSPLLTLAVAILVSPTAAIASPPPYEGTLIFPTINGPSDPEDYSWEVQLGPEQTLEQVDDQHAEVYYEYEHHPAFGIAAEPAHDAEGHEVPTSLVVSAGNVITLVVHHRDGNPAADGAPFSYPVTAGPAFKITEGTVVVDGPPDEQELREIRERIERANPPAELPPPGVRFVKQARHSHPCGKIGGVPVHAHWLTCRTARNIFRAGVLLRGELPDGWACYGELSRCYMGDVGSPHYLWWSRSALCAHRACAQSAQEAAAVVRAPIN